MIINILILILIIYLPSCTNNEKNIGNIEIYETIDVNRINNINFYFVGFEKLDLELKTILRNKLTNEEKILDKDLVKTERINNETIMKVIDVKLSIKNDIIFEIKYLTKVVFKYIGTSEYCIINAKENDGKIDLSFSFRTSPPDFYVGKENPYYKNRDK